jgi:hypothetical protein
MTIAEAFWRFALACGAPVEGETRLTAVRGEGAPRATAGTRAGAAAAIALGWVPASCPLRMAIPVAARPPMKAVVTTAAILIRVASFMAEMVGAAGQPRLRHP